MADRELKKILARDPAEKEFHQALQEVIETIKPVLDHHPEYRQLGVLERITEPERVILFRVPWMDDERNVRVNRGYQVEMCSALGPFKGALRFHPSVNLGILKFLAFEQTLKNALTTLPLGGGAAADTPAEAPEVVSVIAQGADVETVTAAVREVGGTVTRELEIIHAVAADVTPAQERALAEHSAVERVWRDGEVHAQDPEEQR